MPVIYAELLVGAKKMRGRWRSFVLKDKQKDLQASLREDY
jgi:hypothetical protein